MKIIKGLIQTKEVFKIMIKQLTKHYHLLIKRCQEVLNFSNNRIIRYKKDVINQDLQH
jgi:hypothetical protein